MSDKKIYRTVVIVLCITFICILFFCGISIKKELKGDETILRVQMLKRPDLDFSVLFDQIEYSLDKTNVSKLSNPDRDIFLPDIYEDVPEEELIDDSDADGMPDKWELRYGLNPDDPTDAGGDMDKDGFTNLEEYKAGTDPTDPESNPEFRNVAERFRLSKVYRKPIQLLFKGYMQLPDKSHVLTINWGGKTDFKKVEDIIRGYKIKDFVKNRVEKEMPWGGTEPKDNSVMTLERKDGKVFELPIGKIVLEKEIYADIWDRKEWQTYEAYIGAEILGYKVLDIKSDSIVLLAPTQEQIVIEKD